MGDPVRPEVPAALAELARELGVALGYEDGLGRARTVSPDTLVAVIGALDEDLDLRGPEDAPDRLQRVRERRRERLLEPVAVVDEGRAGRVDLSLRRRPRELDCRIELEGGDELAWNVPADSLEAGSRDSLILVLPALRVGYHRLHVRAGRRTASCLLITRPLSGARSRFGSQWRAYGVMAPTYALHSRDTWGAGDVGDLEELARVVAAERASVVATLPLLAGFGPQQLEASPYRPVSRRFWNDRFISLAWLDDLMWSPAAQNLISGAYPPTRRATWQRDGVVDAEAAFSAKRRIVQALAESTGRFIRHNEAGLRDFLLAHPDVTDYARFRAAGEMFGQDWRRWPSTARGGLLRWNDVDPVLVRYHAFAQWLIDEQMGHLSTCLAQRGQTLGLDLPVGVHPDGYDVWRHRDQFAEGASIGAPPDALAAGGQDWGSPPPRPERLRADGHRQLRRALGFHLRVAGVLRIDHVMSLQRLFWVPPGMTPADGTYVAMPMEELMSVLAIEAQRAGADIVGEDLGTVDAALRERMAREGLRRTYVAQYAIDIGAGRLDEAPDGSIASFSTHDTPTFLGWWNAHDVAERESLGLLDDSGAASERAGRRAAREALVTSLGLDAASGPFEVLAAVHARLADGEAGLVIVPVEDLMGDATATNLPGTALERPNWRRLTPLSLEELAETPDPRGVLAPLRDRRGYADVRVPADQPTPQTVHGVTRLSDDDLHLFNEGRHFDLADRLGSHPMTVDGVSGTYFAVWAPNAERVAVVGDFNHWQSSTHPLAPRGQSGIWEGFCPSVPAGELYKYRIVSRLGGHEFDKADPYGRSFEVPPRTASRVWRDEYPWGDADWVAERVRLQGADEPLSIYEVHLGSWRRDPAEPGRILSYRELAQPLADYAVEMGFTHVELLPVMEHPFYGSWGYQTTGYFAPSSRQGTPEDFKHLVDTLHHAGVGVILDWVPSHFPSDAFALAQFDGTHLYEHADERQRVHPDWQSWIFNYGRNEIRSFLISSACFWMREFHADGLRLDAVASMLYLDYSRAAGEWTPNVHGGRENLEAVDFLRQLNAAVLDAVPGAILVAEESTAWSGVTRPSSDGGLGFGYKWDMGWMHDTLQYFARDPLFRAHHHGELTFREIYSASERFVLPLSHDEVVHGKGSLLAKMTGDDWQRRANLRLLLGYQWTLSGKKLLFMGDEIATWSEWDHERSLDWHLCETPEHEGVRRWVAALNALYRAHPALFADVDAGHRFEWVACDDAANSVLVWLRRGRGEELMVAANFTPVPREHYRVRGSGEWVVLTDSDEVRFGGSGYLAGRISAQPVDDVIELTLPPLSLIVWGRPT